MSSADAVRRRVAACVLAGAALGAAGCGDSPAPPLSEGRAARWHDTIAGIRSAAAAADRPTALAALARLSGFVARDAQAGQLAAADAAALKAGIAQARRHLPQPVTAPATATAVAARSAAPAPPPPPVTTQPRQQTSRTTTARPPAAAEPPAAPPASTKDDAKAQKDAAKAQNDAAKVQEQAVKARQRDAEQPRAKAKPEKVKPYGGKP
jgi:hypothetical protein